MSERQDSDTRASDPGPVSVRPDGLPKVSGAARFADDLPVAGLWHGATVRSPHPRARILGIRWHADRAPAGAVCVTARDLPGPNGILFLDDSWPILAATDTNHIGEPVALVAARSREDARLARDAVEIEYEPLDPILSFEGDNGLPAFHEILMHTGHVDAAFATASNVVTGEYRTGHQEHLYLECQAMTADWNGDAVHVTGTMQCPYYVHAALTHAFALEGNRVRVTASAVGGGFGGKEDYPSMIAAHAALLARAAGAPVRIAYDRQEDIIGTTKRHPSLVRHRTAADGEGRLLAMDIEVVLDGGAYLTLSSVVLSRAVLHAAGPYRCPAVRVRGVVRRTNTATNGAFRGFGAPQVAFAVERQMDRLARRVGLDPYEIRVRNVLGPGDRLPTGQQLDGDVAARACLEHVVTGTRFVERWRLNEASQGDDAGGAPRTGLGLSLYFHGAGFTGNGERRMRSPVTARLLDDGRIEVQTVATDMGQGASVALLQIAADAAGATFADLVFTPPDTSLSPDSGPTVASRTTMIVGATVGRAVADLSGRLLTWWRASHDAEAQAIRSGQIVSSTGARVSLGEVARRYVKEAGLLEVTAHHEPPEWQTFDEETFTGAAYPAYSWGADVAEVEVNPDTLETRVVRISVACEIGKVIHEPMCVGQIEGGTLQAVGYALMEEMKVEQGRYVNDRLATYLIPTAQDAPALDVHLTASPLGEAASPKGVGELPIDGGAPAVVAAIENATGLLAARLPVTPEQLLDLERARTLRRTVERP